jgi:putative endonuclease
VRKKHSRGSRGSGRRAETLALWLYRLRGYRVLARNAWVGGYELDLVLRRGRALVFCEVKSKSGARHCDPLEMVTAEKQRRLVRAAETWLAAHPEHDGCEPRFDVVAARGKAAERVQNAF